MRRYTIRSCAHPWISVQHFVVVLLLVSKIYVFLSSLIGSRGSHRLFRIRGPPLATGQTCLGITKEPRSIFFRRRRDSSQPVHTTGSEKRSVYPLDHKITRLFYSYRYACPVQWRGVNPGDPCGEVGEIQPQRTRKHITTHWATRWRDWVARRGSANTTNNFRSLFFPPTISCLFFFAHFFPTDHFLLYNISQEWIDAIFSITLLL